MEVYIGPPEGSASLYLGHEQVLAALAREGIVVRKTDQEHSSATSRGRWTLQLEGDVSLECQEEDGRLVFATMHQSMFDQSDVPDRVCRALASVGWEVDEESVG